MAANLVFKNGYFQTKSRSFPSERIQNGWINFVQRNREYKSQFMQKKYGYGFDGYSFMGQKDSSNQYATDLLHSFVISDFQNSENFPREFDLFFEKDWQELQDKIRSLELEIITQLDYPGLADFYLQHIGHMISCNYYPSTETVISKALGHVRLSAHTDVSLFTIFPFGFDQDFYFENAKGEWLNIPATTDIVMFPGYLLERFSQGKWKALNHKVALPRSRKKERFSFAYFSLPYPERKFYMGGERQSSESYFAEYLRLF